MAAFAALSQVLILLLNIYSFILLARVLLSWFPDINPYNPIVQLLYNVTEPVLAPVREFLRRQFPDMGMFDFSPLVVFFTIIIMQQILALPVR